MSPVNTQIESAELVQNTLFNLTTKYLSDEINIEQFSRSFIHQLIEPGIDNNEGKVKSYWVFFHNTLKRESKKIYANEPISIFDTEKKLIQKYGFTYLDQYVVNRNNCHKDILITNDKTSEYDKKNKNIEVFCISEAIDTLREIEKQLMQYKGKSGYFSFLSIALAQREMTTNLEKLFLELNLQNKEDKAFLLSFLKAVEDSIEKGDGNYYLYYINPNKEEKGDVLKGVLGFIMTEKLEGEKYEQFTNFTEDFFKSKNAQTFSSIAKVSANIGAEKGAGIIARSFRHNILTHLDFLKYAVDEQDRQEVIDDIRKVVKVMGYCNSYKEISDFVNDNSKETFNLLDEVHKIITRYKDIFRKKDIYSVTERFPSVTFESLKKQVDNDSLVKIESQENIDYSVKTVKALALTVLKDIISNAFKYSDYKKPEVRITLERLKESLKIVISNNDEMSEKYYNRFKESVTKVSFYEFLTDDQRLGMYIYKYFCFVMDWKIEINDFEDIKKNKKTDITLFIPFMLN